MIPNLAVPSAVPICQTTKSWHLHNPIMAESNSIYPTSPPVNSSKNYKLKSLIIGDSHVKRLSKNVINYETKEDKVWIKNFDGGKSKHINHHVLPFLHENLPEIVIIHSGTNDINENLIHITRPDELARTVVNIAKTCKNFGVTNIGVSSILPQRNQNVCKIIQETNDLLKSMCDFNNFTFIDNSNKNENFLSPDNIHLSDVGSRFLEANFIEFLKKCFD